MVVGEYLIVLTMTIPRGRSPPSFPTQSRRHDGSPDFDSR